MPEVQFQVCTVCDDLELCAGVGPPGLSSPKIQGPTRELPVSLLFEDELDLAPALGSIHPMVSLGQTGKTHLS